MRWLSLICFIYGQGQGRTYVLIVPVYHKGNIWGCTGAGPALVLGEQFYLVFGGFCEGYVGV